MTTPASDAREPRPSLSGPEIVSLLEHAGLFFQVAVSGLRNDVIEGEEVWPGVCVRDVVAHLAIWQQLFLQTAEALLGRDGAGADGTHPMPGEWGPCQLSVSDTTFRPEEDAAHLATGWHARELARRQSGAVGTVFVEFDRAHTRLLKVARRVKPRSLVHVGSWPNGGSGSLADLLVLAATHTQIHSQGIREWRVRRAP